MTGSSEDQQLHHDLKYVSKAKTREEVILKIGTNENLENQAPR